MFCLKNISVQTNVSHIMYGTTGDRTDNLCFILKVLFLLNYRSIPTWIQFIVELGYFIEMTDYRSNFEKTILFENCSCFLKRTYRISVECPRIFQCLISIPADNWVRQIDGDLPFQLFLSALLSLVISKTGRSERSVRALRDGADVVREAVGSQFCVRICYVPNIKMKMRLRSRSVHNAKTKNIQPHLNVRRRDASWVACQEAWKTLSERGLCYWHNHR